jgi:hypothetical protein
MRLRLPPRTPHGAVLEVSAGVHGDEVLVLRIHVQVDRRMRAPPVWWP